MTLSQALSFDAHCLDVLSQLSDSIAFTTFFQGVLHMEAGCPGEVVQPCVNIGHSSILVEAQRGCHHFQARCPIDSKQFPPSVTRVNAVSMCWNTLSTHALRHSSTHSSIRRRADSAGMPLLAR